jgi:glyceraldehyde 3-phosphate dehydrogenase
MKYLLKYDTVYGESDITLDGVKMISEKDPTKLPWKELDIDVVVESTGLYTATDKAQVHIAAGAKRVVITAPIKDDDSPTVLLAMNEENSKVQPFLQTLHVLQMPQTLSSLFSTKQSVLKRLF